MILTGKAKEAFLEYYWETKINPLPMTICKKSDLEEFFNSIIDIFQNTLIIEFFDSVGIYATILVCHDLRFDGYIATKERRSEASEFNETRQQATKKVIEKANEIYNKYHQ